MPDYYGPGAHEVPRDDANEGFADIPQNRTLLAAPLTDLPPVQPEIVYGLTTVEEVFAHFNPEKDVTFTSEDGAPLKETMHFRTLGDFGRKGLTKQSAYLQGLQQQADDYRSFSRQLKGNKILQSILDDPRAKEAYLVLLRTLIEELAAADVA